MYLLVFVALILGAPVAALFIGKWKHGEDHDPRKSFLAGLLLSLLFVVVAIYCWKQGLFLRA